jgi:hypothetical protein
LKEKKKRIKMTCNACLSGSGNCSCNGGDSSSGSCSSANAKIEWQVYEGMASDYALAIKNINLVSLGASATIDFVKTVDDTAAILSLSSTMSSQIRITNNLVGDNPPYNECLVSYINVHLTASQIATLAAASSVVIGDLIIDSSVAIPPIRFVVRYNKTTKI